jgi:23S rRNA pseudouridine1911/1915/1917 synthase
MSENTATAVSSQGFEYGVKHFYNQRSGLITEILFEALAMPQEQALHLLKLGAVYVGNQRQTADIHINENQLFRVHSKPRHHNCNYNWRELVVFENQDFVILNKPSGVPSHPAVDNIIDNSLTQLSQALNTPLLITHRLDTLTAGLIVYAKNNAFVKNFNQQMQNRCVEKKYVALVESAHVLPPRLIHYMEPSPRAPKKVSETFTQDWAFCELEILNQKKMGQHCWVKINLLTGRTHQIRAQFSQAQAPILGDTLYGAQTPYKAEAIALRACELQFNWGQQLMRFNLDEDFDIY